MNKTGFFNSGLCHLYTVTEEGEAMLFNKKV